VISDPPNSILEWKRSGVSTPLETRAQTVYGTAPVGIVAGYFSTWDADRGGRFGVPDMFVKGCWQASLAEHRARGNRQVRVKDSHGRTIGGAPIDEVREDAHGLYGVAYINQTSPAGREIYSLAQQGVISDFSVGFTPTKDKIEGGVRKIFAATLWEVSLVDEPANPEARILEVREAILDVEDGRTVGNSEEAALASILRNLEGARNDLRRSEAKRAAPTTDREKAAMAAMYRNLVGALNDLRS